MEEERTRDLSPPAPLWTFSPLSPFPPVPHVRSRFFSEVEDQGKEGRGHLPRPLVYTRVAAYAR